MRFLETELGGAFVIELEPHEDERGFFARSFCRNEYKEHALNPHIAQCNISYNRKRGTLRGMHYQAAPKAEAKTVMCTKGAIHDVIVDLRPNSSTYCRWLSFELTAENRKMLYIPEGFAHGFQTLIDDTDVLYLMSEFYSPKHARGVRYNDSAFGIQWPLEDPIVSPRDRSYEDFRP
jgi:dTDP-4-dehydrorhamnose 3,5-epimerase